MSLLPSSGTMNPYPFLASNHFTRPAGITDLFNDPITQRKESDPFASHQETPPFFVQPNLKLALRGQLTRPERTIGRGTANQYSPSSSPLPRQSTPEHEGTSYRH